MTQQALGEGRRGPGRLDEVSPGKRGDVERVADSRRSLRAETQLVDQSVNAGGRTAIDVTSYDGELAGKDVTVKSAPVRLPSGETVQKTLVLTLQRAVLKGDKDVDGRWIVTKFRRRGAGDGNQGCSCSDRRPGLRAKAQEGGPRRPKNVGRREGFSRASSSSSASSRAYLARKVFWPTAANRTTSLVSSLSRSMLGTLPTPNCGCLTRMPRAKAQLPVDWSLVLRNGGYSSAPGSS